MEAGEDHEDRNKVNLLTLPPGAFKTDFNFLDDLEIDEQEFESIDVKPIKTHSYSTTHFQKTSQSDSKHPKPHKTSNDLKLTNFIEYQLQRQKFTL